MDYSSDAFLEAYGRSYEEAFANAARALLSLMLDIRRVSSRGLSDGCEVEGNDLENLLYNWLECILNRFSIDGRAYSRFDVKIECGHGHYVLKANMKGERYDPQGHGIGREVKAVTYHEMNIYRKDDLYAVRFLLDL